MKNQSSQLKHLLIQALKTSPNVISIRVLSWLNIHTYLQLYLATIIQFEKRGYYIIDKINTLSNSDSNIELIYIPSGRSKHLSDLPTKV